MIGIDTSPLLKIKKVVVTGELGCYIKLDSGINIIRGEAYEGDIKASNDCGKTVFMNLIKYGLGERDRFSTGEIARKIDMVFLEIELNGSIFTIARKLNMPGARISIYEGSYQSELIRKPYMQIDAETPYSNFLLRQLGIPCIQIPQSQKPGAPIRPITFQDFMRVFYMDQKNSFQEILYRVQPDWLKTKILQILLGMSSHEAEQIDLKIKKLIDDIANLKREIENITSFLTQSADANQIKTSKKRNELVQGIELLNAQIYSLKQQMRGQKGITDELRERLNEISRRLSELQENRTKLIIKVKDFQALMNSLTVDKEKVHKLQEAVFILSSVDFVNCPRCLQRVTTEMRMREDNARCLLCDRPLLTDVEKTRIPDKDEILDEEINEVRILLERYQCDQQRLDIEINRISTQKIELQEKLDMQSASYVSPFVDELERLLLEQNQIKASIEIIDQNLRQWQLLKEREEELDKLKIKQEELQCVANKINTHDVTKIKKLSDYYESFLHSIKFPNLKTARIQSSDLMPLVNGHLYTEDTGIGSVSVKVIGYHYALLRFSLDNPCYYPRFLMLDSPKVFDINPETYESVLLQFHRLQDNIGIHDFQVIITARDLPEEMEQYVIERLNSINRMLLRPKRQREQSY